MSVLSRFPIELREHDPAWATIAHREADRLREALRDVLIEVHHIGSTAIAGIRAKPIVDLLPVVRSLDELDAARARIEALGYLWRGEDGIGGRRYCVLFANAADFVATAPDLPAERARVAQLHFFASSSSEIQRHLAFRDYLRAHDDERLAYEREKLRARSTHPDDVLAYNAEKAAWIRACEARARAWADSHRG